MCVPCSPSPNRIASAQPPAKAAPNTSAPIRMAALTTVMTLGQAMRRDEVEAFIGVGSVVLLRGAISPKSRSVASANSSKIGIRDVRTPPKYGHPASRCQPAAEGLDDAVCDPAVRRDRARALHAGL